MREAAQSVLLVVGLPAQVRHLSESVKPAALYAPPEEVTLDHTGPLPVDRLHGRVRHRHYEEGQLLHLEQEAPAVQPHVRLVEVVTRARRERVRLLLPDAVDDPSRQTPVR